MDLNPEAPHGRAFAVSVTSWAMAIARTMDSPRPWWSSTRAVESLEGLEEAVDLVRAGARFAHRRLVKQPEETGEAAQAA